MIMLLLVAVIGTAAFVLLTRTLWATKRPQKSTLIVGSAIALVFALVILTATGRMHWAGAIGAMLVPFFRVLMTVLRIAPAAAKIAALFKMGRPGAAPGGSTHKAANGPSQSEVTTADIHMVLDHDTGVMTGTILRGEYEGRSLADLDDAALGRLLATCQDAESQQLLQAYIERHRPDFQGDGDTNGSTVSNDGEMTPERAYQILDLPPGATSEEVVTAHRRLMQRLHPDRGGSSFLAAELNAAKQVLLGSRGS